MLTNKDSQYDNEKTDSNFIKYFQNTCSCIIHCFFGGKISCITFRKRRMDLV